MFNEKLNQDYLQRLSNLIQGMGQLTQIWTITYQSFKEQKMESEEALMHTKALMTTMVKAMLEVQKEEG